MKRINKMNREYLKVKNIAKDFRRMMQINNNSQVPYFSDMELAETVGSIIWHGFNYRLTKEMIAKYGSN